MFTSLSSLERKNWGLECSYEPSVGTYLLGSEILKIHAFQCYALNLRRHCSKISMYHMYSLDFVPKSCDICDSWTSKCQWHASSAVFQNEPRSTTIFWRPKPAPKFLCVFGGWKQLPRGEIMAWSDLELPPLKLTAKASENRPGPGRKRLYSNRIHFQVAFAVSSR